MNGGKILLSRTTKKSYGNTSNSLTESKLKLRMQLRITFFTCLGFTSMLKQHIIESAALRPFVTICLYRIQSEQKRVI